MNKLHLVKDDLSYRITLDAPPLNILDIQMLSEMRDALMSVKNDRALLIIDAAGDRAFSAGASIQDHLKDRIEKMLTTFHDCFRILHRLNLVSVARVKGMALGGGCELAFACDLVLASDKAIFGQPEINLGVFAPVGSYQLSRLLPPRKGLELFITGAPVPAAKAAEYGLVNAVLPFDDFERASDEWLAQVRRHSPSSVRFAKRAFRLSQPDDFDARLAETERLYLEELMRTEDAEEGLNAFLEKRKPEWKGR